MFSQIFVSYLMKKNVLSLKQATEVLEAQRTTKIRLGVLAVEGKFMTESQVEYVNQLQASRNARFGDIAIQEGYLTKERLEQLLNQQPKEHMILKQILCDNKFMTSSQIDEELSALQNDLRLKDDEFEGLLSNDVDIYISKIAGINEDDLVLCEYAKLFIKTTLRLIDGEMLLKDAYTVDTFSAKHFISQHCYGDDNLTVVFSADDDASAKKFAEVYAKTSFEDGDEDIPDALTEFLNCVSGLLISELSNSGKLELDIDVPVYIASKSLVVVEKFTVLPFSLSIGDFSIFIFRKEVR